MTSTESTREKIVETARALWMEKGFEQATMRELARRMNMGVSSLYFYFKSKEEIVHFLYAEINRKTIDNFRLVDDGDKSLTQNFSKYMSTKISLLKPHKSAFIALMKEAVDPNSAVSPLSSDSDTTRSINQALLEELVIRAGSIAKQHCGNVARLLWFLNLAVLLYWMHDKSSDSANTFELIDKVSKFVGVLPVLTRMPGADTTFQWMNQLIQTKESQKSAAASLQVTELAAKNVDVIVLGGGPLACVYSCFVKMQRPATKILIIERHSDPGHKIGESTLSGFCKALKTIGIHPEAMRTLFYPKNGLGFLSVDRNLQSIVESEEYILETFDETYQVERRALDSLLLANARRMGIEVLQGAVADVKSSTFSDHGNAINYTIGNREYQARAPLVVDASGPAGLLAREFGLWNADGLPFQTSAGWTYFRSVRPLASLNWPHRAMFPRDQYTQHLCLREGWLWYIPIVSWQQSPNSNFTRGLDACLGSPRSIPSRTQLSEDFGCPYENIVSIGLVLRSDRDRWLKDDVREAFEHYKRKYPAIRQLLDGAEQIEDHYQTGQTFMQRLAFRGCARRVAGDGWLLIGDAAFFVDPLISPGLTGGTATAYRAALTTVNALEQHRFDGDVFAGYESFVHELRNALERDNQLVYMSFNHPQAIALVQRLQEIDARRHFHENAKADYGLADTNVWGILSPSYQEMQRQAWEIMHQNEQQLSDVPIDEQTMKDYQPMVTQLKSLLDNYLESNRDLTPYFKVNSEVKIAR